ncbi:MAG TPA: transglycosylase domain-containing protein [Candidatus Saccharibacteria bacterium]|nr:transglycosylase domain-containing protein [Candidatus Saccharibacteria bacterium]
MKKDSNKGSIRKPAHRKGAHSVYSNLTNQKRTKADAKSRKKAEFLATLPKSRVKRIAYRLHPRRFFKYWFSKQGFIMMLKLAGLGLAVGIILILTIFAVFRKDLALGPDELTKRVQSRTTKFYDRTGQVLLYELYKDQQLTFVKPDQISNNMKYATVAIEDKDFYKHGGFDIRGIIRSVVNNASGGGKQGASTITQQLARNVILEDNTRSGIAGYTRKLKEIILSIELERTYSKDEILNFYLNSIGYGGTAYGVESASKRYFDKSAKDLSIEEAAYIASIPQYPSLYDRNSPSFDTERTVARQKTVIDYMRDQGYIKSEEAKTAKAVDILTVIKPLTNDPTTKRAPHFVDEIGKQLEGQYGADNVRKGGWRIVTTLDWDMQQLAEETVKKNMNAVERQRGDNAALVAIDVTTNQVLSLVGSRDYNHPGYGSYNAATANLQPGSSLKPIVYSKLFEGNQYGPGSTLSDEKKCWGGWCPNNFDKRFRGSISIRQALAESRNIPAIKAAEASGMNSVIDLAKSMGETNIGCGESCEALGLSIGSGSVRLDQHTAAYATLARGGTAKPQTYILKIEKSNGEIVQQWKDSPGVKTLGDKGPEISYLISDILADDRARRVTFGNPVGFNPKGVKAAVKTGTTDSAKDGWMMGYTPKLAVGIWVGRSDGTVMNSTTHTQTGPMFGEFMSRAHLEIMTRPQYGYKSNDWFTKPAGIQNIKVSGRQDLFQSWFKKPKETNKDFVMDKVSRRVATECTPEGARETIQVMSSIDPVTNKETVGTPPEGWDIQNPDNVHQCGVVAASDFSIATAGEPSKTRTITTSFVGGPNPIQTVEFIVNGQVISAQPGAGGLYSTSYAFPDVGSYSIQIRVTDSLYYQATSSGKTVLIGS